MVIDRRNSVCDRRKASLNGHHERQISRCNKDLLITCNFFFSFIHQIYNNNIKQASKNTKVVSNNLTAYKSTT